MSQTEITDYLCMINKNTPKKERDKMNIGDLFINAAVCIECKEYIRSMNRHDFKWCNCGSIAVDGGSCYARRIGEPSKIINIIELFKDAN